MIETTTTPTPTTTTTVINLNEVYLAYDVPISQFMIRDIAPKPEVDIQKKEIQKNNCCSCSCCTDNKTNTSDEDVSLFISLWLYFNDVSLCGCLSYCCNGDCCDGYSCDDD